MCGSGTVAASPFPVPEGAGAPEATGVWDTAGELSTEGEPAPWPPDCSRTMSGLGADAGASSVAASAGVSGDEVSVLFTPAGIAAGAVGDTTTGAPGSLVGGAASAVAGTPSGVAESPCLPSSHPLPHNFPLSRNKCTAQLGYWDRKESQLIKNTPTVPVGLLNVLCKWQ